MMKLFFELLFNWRCQEQKSSPSRNLTQFLQITDLFSSLLKVPLCRLGHLVLQGLIQTQSDPVERLFPSLLFFFFSGTVFWEYTLVLPRTSAEATNIWISPVYPKKHRGECQTLILVLMKATPAQVFSAVQNDVSESLGEKPLIPSIKSRPFRG